MKPMKHGQWSGQSGGAALEYVIVSAFATITALAAVAYVGTMMKERINQLSKSLGIATPIDWPIDIGSKDEDP